MSDISRQSEAANIPIIAGSSFPSKESNVTVILTSFLISLSKRGLSVLSINLDIKTDSSEGFPSLLVNLEPNILPPA